MDLDIELLLLYVKQNKQIRRKVEDCLEPKRAPVTRIKGRGGGPEAERGGHKRLSSLAVRGSPEDAAAAFSWTHFLHL